MRYLRFFKSYHEHFLLEAPLVTPRSPCCNVFAIRRVALAFAAVLGFALGAPAAWPSPQRLKFARAHPRLGQKEARHPEGCRADIKLAAYGSEKTSREPPNCV